MRVVTVERAASALIAVSCSTVLGTLGSVPSMLSKHIAYVGRPEAIRMRSVAVSLALTSVEAEMGVTAAPVPNVRLAA